MLDIDDLIKAYDIRGTYPDQINSNICRKLGEAFAALIRKESDSSSVVIARDMRPSGPELVKAFADGIRANGVDVVDVGLGSTDLLYFASGFLDMPGAMFTASHNPAEYNGIKLCMAQAQPVGADSGLDFIKSYLANNSEADANTEGVYSTRDLLSEFGDHVRSFVSIDNLRPLKVLADTANGMGGYVLPEIFSKLPFELEILYPELDGTFPNHEANPLDPKNLVDLQKKVQEVGADIGLAFDGDADRVFLVDEMANPVSGSITTALLAKSILKKNPGSKVIHNLICSKSVPEVIVEFGGVPVRSRVGHSYIKQLMSKEDAVFGGEHSAHYYFKDNWRADSGLIASLLVLEQLSMFNGPLSELVSEFDRYSASGEINTKVDDAELVIKHVEDHYHALGASLDHLDGLTVDFGDWWFNLRPSNTEPLLRLNLEAPTDQEVESRVQEVQEVMKST